VKILKNIPRFTIKVIDMKSTEDEPKYTTNAHFEERPKTKDSITFHGLKTTGHKLKNMLKSINKKKSGKNEII
jgi:hypothetical protein